MSDSSPPTVLAIDDEENILETYRIWLGSSYDLRTAAGGEAALDEIDDSVDVVLLDRLMPGVSGDEVLTEIRERGYDCQVALVTAVEPDYEIADLPLDDYVRKALDRETVRATVERLAERRDASEAVRELHAVATKLVALEDRKPGTDLVESSVYRDLSERFRELEAELSADERPTLRAEPEGHENVHPHDTR